MGIEEIKTKQLKELEELTASKNFSLLSAEQKDVLYGLITSLEDELITIKYSVQWKK